MEYKILKMLSLNKNIAIFVVTTIFVLLFLKQCNQISNLKHDLNNTEMVANRNLNNFEAAKDSITTERNRSGQLVSKISSFEYDIEVLKSEKSKLLTKYNGLLNENAKLISVNNLIYTELTVKDSILNSNVEITQTEDSIEFKFNDKINWDKYNYREFSGVLELVRFDSIFNIKSSRFDFNQGISLTTAIIKENGRNGLRITSPYPGLKFTNIENINIVNDRLNPVLQKPKNWSIGFGLQYGFNLNNNQIISNGFSVGIGLQYSPSWLRF